MLAGIIEVSSSGPLLPMRAWLVKTDGVGDVQWNRTISIANSSSTDAFYVRQMPDGGYMIVGSSSNGNGVFLAKTDLNGNVIWNRTYGFFGLYAITCAAGTSDSGYVVAGTHGLIKIRGDETLEWNSTFWRGGHVDDWIYSVQQTSDGGYVLAGRTESFGAGLNDALLLKTNSTGNLQWYKTYGGIGEEEAHFVLQTSDGAYVVVGLTTSYGSGGCDAWLVKTDAHGNAEWNMTYGGTQFDEAWDIQAMTDGGFLIAGKTDSYSTDGFAHFWLVKTDSNGHMRWEKVLAQSAAPDWPVKVQITSDGRLVIGGTANSNGDELYFWIAEVEGSISSVSITAFAVWTSVTPIVLALCFLEADRSKSKEL
jgi:hypothetical protein